MSRAGGQVEIASTGGDRRWGRLRWIRVLYCGVGYNHGGAAYTLTHTSHMSFNGLSLNWSFIGHTTILLHNISTRTHTHTPDQLREVCRACSL